MQHSRNVVCTVLPEQSQTESFHGSIGECVLKPVPFEQLPEEELVLLARTDRGAMENIVKRYTGAVWHQVRRFQGISEPEDLAQEGFLGLISAVCRYDPMRGVPFSAYAGKCIINSIVSALRRCRNLPLPVGASDMPPLSQVQDDALPPDSVAQSRVQTGAMFCAMVSRLSRREYQVCMLIFGGASYAQAAERLHLSVKSVDNALQRARRKLHSAAPDAV